MNQSHDNQIKKQTSNEKLLWPLTSTASNRLALRGKRITIQYPSIIGHYTISRSGCYDVTEDGDWIRTVHSENCSCDDEYEETLC